MLDSKAKLFNTMVAHGKVLVLYQPKVDAETRKVVGYEALSRLGNRDNIISPAVFMDILTDEMRVRLFITVLNIIQRDINSGLFDNNIRLSLNIEPKTLLSPLISDILKLVNYQVAEMLEIEIIEKPIPSNEWSKLYSIMDTIKSSTSFTFSLDDFGVEGAGFKSLHLPGVVGVKLDGSLIPKNESQKRVFENTTTMLKSIGMKLTLEKVETEEEASELRHLVDEFQGYLFGKPTILR